MTKEIRILSSLWPEKTPGVRVTHQTFRTKCELVELTPALDGIVITDKAQIPYTCNHCGYVGFISNATLEKAINRARISDDGGAYLVNPVCKECQNAYRAVNPRVGNNQSKLDIPKLAEIYEKGNFILDVESLDKEKRLNTNVKYLCNCIICGNSQEQSGQDIKRKRANCIFCNKGKVAEKRIREALEQLFGESFSTSRRLFSKDEIRRTYDDLGEPIKDFRPPVSLEIDCYSSEVNLGVEHHGDQHYKITKFTPTQQDLDHLRRCDQATEILCGNHGIVLITLQQLKDFSPEGVRKHLEPSLIEAGYEFSDEKWNSIEYSVTCDPYSMNIVNKLEGWGYKVLTEPPYRQDQHIKYQCDKNHTRHVTANSIEMGYKCLKCAGKAPLEHGELQEIANLLGWIILSAPENPSSEDKIKIGCRECNQGITWFADKPEYRRLRWFKSQVEVADDGQWQLKSEQSHYCNPCKWKKGFLKLLKNKKNRLGYEQKVADWKKHQQSKRLSPDQQELLKLVQLESWEELDNKLKALGWKYL